MALAKTIAILFILLLFGVLFVWAFSLLPVDRPGQALDWKNFYRSTHGFSIDPGNRVFNPPWILALLWPLTAWSLPVSRGLAALVTVIVFLLCVPRVRSNLVWMLSVFLLLFSYPMILHLMDGNIEAFIVGGVLLALYAVKKVSPILLAISLLLLSAKTQESWLLLPFLVFYAWRNWPKPKLLKTALALGAVVVPFLIWKGSDWFQAMQTFPYERIATNSSMRLVLIRLGFEETIVWGLSVLFLMVTLLGMIRQRVELDTKLAGLLIVAGLLLSNYAGTLSLVTVMGLGVIPLFQRRSWFSLPLIMLFYFPYLVVTRIELRLAWENVYWTGVLLLTWAVLVWELNQQRKSFATVA